MLPQSAPSVAILTGSGATASRSRPSALEVRAPGRLVGEALDLVRREPVDHRPGESVLAHVGERFGVDDVVAVAGAQDRQEVAAALGGAGREEGEAVVAELGGDPVARAMPGAGVVHRDPGRGLKPRAQHRLGLLDEGLDAAGQEPHDLALGDREPERGEEGRDPLHRHLALMVLQQHEAAQLRAEMAAHARRQAAPRGFARRVSASVPGGSGSRAAAARGPGRGSPGSP